MNVYINTKVSTVTSILIDRIKIALQRYWYEYNIRKHVTIEHIKLQLKCNMCNTRVSTDTSILIENQDGNAKV